MMKQLMKVLLFAGLLVSVGNIQADSWPVPSPRIFASEDGKWGFKVVPLPAGSGAAKIAHGMAFTLNPSGEEIIQWKSDLVNVPVKVMIFHYMERNKPMAVVVTLDDWGKEGYAHSLVIYGPQGELVKDYALEDLFTPDAIRRFDKTTSSRRWTDTAVFHFEARRDYSQAGRSVSDLPRLNIALPDKTRVRVDLQNGRILNSLLDRKD